MKDPIIAKFEELYCSSPKNLPSFRAGDTVRVHYKVEETAKAGSDEKKYRLQVFEGVCLRRKEGGKSSSTFTVRKIGANSVGVERVFPLNSPHIENIEVLASGRVRRARLYYLRERSGKAARIKARRLPPVLAVAKTQEAAASES